LLVCLKLFAETIQYVLNGLPIICAMLSFYTPGRVSQVRQVEG